MDKSVKRKLNEKKQKPNDDAVFPMTHKQLANMLHDLPISDLIQIVKKRQMFTAGRWDCFQRTPPNRIP